MCVFNWRQMATNDQNRTESCASPIDMNDFEKRTCPFCAETIEAKAKICPRCHLWLTFKSLRHPVVSLFVHLVPMIIFLGALMFAFCSILSEFQNPKPYYSEFPNSLRILDSRMNWAQTKDGLRIYVTGVLTNDSPIPWKDIEFDCRFFDANGVMIDADTRLGYFTILSHDDTAFRVAIVPTAPTNEYMSFKTLVGDARNMKSWF